MGSNGPKYGPHMGLWMGHIWAHIGPILGLNIGPPWARIGPKVGQGPLCLPLATALNNEDPLPFMLNMKVCHR
jgi:hypothetical protein